MYAEISAAIQSVKTVAELAKAATSLANHAELVTAVADVSTKLMEATAVALASQERQGELLSKVSALERELRELRAIQARTEKYALHKFTTGALAYKLLEAFESTEPAHFLCTKCVDGGGHTKLQPFGNRRLKCFTCDKVIQTEFDPPVEPRITRSRSPFV